MSSSEKTLDNLATPDEIERARDEYAFGSNDQIEIDDGAAASRGEGGLWIAAWVWLGDES